MSVNNCGVKWDHVYMQPILQYEYCSIAILLQQFSCSYVDKKMGLLILSKVIMSTFGFPFFFTAKTVTGDNWIYQWTYTGHIKGFSIQLPLLAAFTYFPTNMIKRDFTLPDQQRYWHKNIILHLFHRLQLVCWQTSGMPEKDFRLSLELRFMIARSVGLCGWPYLVGIWYEQ